MFDCSDGGRSFQKDGPQRPLYEVHLDGTGLDLLFVFRSVLILGGTDSTRFCKRPSEMLVHIDMKRSSMMCGHKWMDMVINNTQVDCGA